MDELQPFDEDDVPWELPPEEFKELLAELERLKAQAVRENERLKAELEQLEKGTKPEDSTRLF